MRRRGVTSYRAKHCKVTLMLGFVCLRTRMVSCLSLRMRMSLLVYVCMLTTLWESVGGTLCACVGDSYLIGLDPHQNQMVA